MESLIGEGSPGWSGLMSTAHWQSKEPTTETRSGFAHVNSDMLSQFNQKKFPCYHQIPIKNTLYWPLVTDTLHILFLFSQSKCI